MRHPFDGVNSPPCAHQALMESPERGSRRALLSRICAATAGAVLVMFGRNASAQTPLDRRRRRPTTYAVGEEGGGSWSWPQRHSYPVTTRRWGEEGATTFALGEEGGGATTFALGEEGGGATTYALGEEGGGATTFAFGEEGGATTFALGEEGGRGTSGRRQR